MSPAGPRAQLEPVLRLLFDGAAEGAWRKAVVVPAKGGPPAAWQRLTASPVMLRRGPAIKFVTRANGRETTATIPLEKWPERLMDAIEAGPCHLEVLARDHDWHARRTRDGRWLVTRSRPSLAGEGEESKGPPAHDRVRRHPLDPRDERARALFIETGLFGKNGQLLGDAAAKYRQVQHYIELLRQLPAWDGEGPVRVVDAGCGKAYLSLSLALWAEQNGRRVELEGVDSSPEVLRAARRAADAAGLDGARFHASSIASFAASHAGPVDILLSLHACDTATDEALAAGVRLGAGAIVLVPCCHHELSEQIELAERDGSLPAAERWGAVLGSGLLRHRLADVVTDALRAEALGALGYRVDVLEFVSPEATARNLMIRASKRARGDAGAERAALGRYRALAEEWAARPALERHLGELWPPAV